jgi:ribosomal protein S18 acetylase RimI-like enzyme
MLGDFMRVVASRFDSEHYGLDIGRIVAEPSASAADLRAAIAAAESQFHVVFLRTPEGSSLDRELRRRGESPADVLVTSMWNHSPPKETPFGAPTQVSGRTAQFAIEAHERLTANADISAIEAVSAQVLRRSHLHSDPRLPAERTRRYYAAWARNNAMGRAQRTLVARAAGQVIGYLSVLDANDRVVIDLVAVGAAWQGQGVGAALLAELSVTLAKRDKIVATVGTQADNPALKLYQRFGYVPSESHATYHLWLDGEG